MSAGMDHDDDLELLGAYALGAVDDDERRRVDALLARSPEARAELARYEHAMGALTDAEATTPLPTGSWDRMRAALHADDTGPADDARAPGLPALRLPPRAAPDDGVVVPLRPRGRRPLVLLSAAAAVLAAGLTIGTLIRSDGPSLRETAAAVLADPTSRRGTLSGEVGGTGVAVPVAVDARGTGYLFGDELPRLDEGRVYQLWSLDGAAPVSLAVLGRDGGLTTFIGGGVRQLAISTEEAPGVTAPTNPVAAGDLA